MTFGLLAWLLAIAILLGYEFWSLSASGKARGAWPLTWVVWRIFQRWPLLGFVAGLVAGGLGVHFFGGKWSCPKVLP